jgi:DNA-binding beta-propeller fold protein YncE
LEHLGYVLLPQHAKPGGFDHAAVHGGTGRLYVAHTANDALDIIDCETNQHVGSIPDLTGVAGVLVSEEQRLVFTSNRAENTVGIFSPTSETTLVKVAVGTRPNGLAYDPVCRLLLAANVGDPGVPGSFSVSLVDVERKVMVADVPVPGRTRWAVFDAEAGVFCVNIADPPQIAVIDGRTPDHLVQSFSIPVAGPHGLDLDPGTGRLFCACDGKKLVSVDSRSGKILSKVGISGVPDVVFFNPALKHLYVAIGDPGVIEVFESETLGRLEIVQTEKGAHTLAFDPTRNTVYAFLSETHRAAIYSDAC